MQSHRSKSARARVIGAVLLGTVALAACSTPTPYRPLTGSGAYATGYADTRIESNRYRVSFAGNSITQRETVERYLLFRAAQLTLEQGFEHFVLVDRDTEPRTEVYSTPSAFGGPWGGWSPYWNYYRPHYGWRRWSPFYGDPFWDRSVDVRSVTRYEATAEIVLGRGPKPATNVRAFDARAVIENLGPSVVTPQPR